MTQRTRPPFKIIRKLIVGALFEVCGSLLAIVVYLFQQGQSILGIIELPMEPIPLYIVAAAMLGVGMIFSIKAALALKRHQTASELADEKMQENPNEDSIIQR